MNHLTPKQDYYQVPVRVEPEIDQEIVRQIQQQGIIKPYQDQKVNIVYIKDSFNTTSQSHNSRQLRYSESRQISPKMSRQIPFVFAGFWGICMLVLLSMAVGDN